MKEVGAIIARQFPSSRRPAVSFVVGQLAVPGAQVAMDAVGVQTPQDNLAFRDIVRDVSNVAVLPPGPKIYVSGMADTNNLPIATRKTLEKLLAAIGDLDLSKQDIVQVKAFLQPMSEVEVVREEIVRFFDGKAPPTVFVEWISPAPNPPIEIELIAAGKGDVSKEPESVTFLTPTGTTDSKVFRRVARVNHGKLIYLSGLYGTRSSDGAGQVREIFASLGDILKKTGSDFDHLAKATYYVTDDDASKALNEIRPEFYNPLRAPAASKAKVKGVGLANKTVTLDMIAVTK
jgi:enamine deaminase RidA (YjgF/YER057c/UK114 family)